MPRAAISSWQHLPFALQLFQRKKPEHFTCFFFTDVIIYFNVVLLLFSKCFMMSLKLQNSEQRCCLCARCMYMMQTTTTNFKAFRWYFQKTTNDRSLFFFCYEASEPTFVTVWSNTLRVSWIKLRVSQKIITISFENKIKNNSENSKCSWDEISQSNSTLTFSNWKMVDFACPILSQK